MLICFLKQSKWLPNSLCERCFVPVVLAQVPQQFPEVLYQKLNSFCFLKLGWIKCRAWMCISGKINQIKRELIIVLPVSCFAWRCRCPVKLGTSPTSFLHNLWSSSWFPPLPLPRWGGSRVKMQLLWSTMTCSVQSPSWAQVGNSAACVWHFPSKVVIEGVDLLVLWEETWVSFMWCFLVEWDDPSLSLLDYLIDWK